MQKVVLRLGWSLALLTSASGCELLDPDGDGIEWPGDDDGDSDPPNPPVGCEAVLCIEGTVCIDGADGPVCVPHEEHPCNLVDCPPERPVCDVVDGEAICIELRDCSTVKCAAGFYCDDISGQAECLPLPSCDGVECEAGSVCELVEVQCVRAPCPPQPSCLPASAGIPCGPNTCAVGEVCCNESCGICTPPDGFCTEQYCGAAE